MNYVKNVTELIRNTLALKINLASGNLCALEWGVVMQERAYRSIIKTISWRTIGTIDTMVISYIITGNLVMAASIGSIEVVTKMILYYFHERAWNKIKIGKHEATANDYHI